MSYRDNPRSKEDKPRHGILTNKQRQYLQGDGSGLHEQTQRDREDAIQDRVYNSILDFALLFEEWPDDEREDVFGDLLDDEDGRDGLADMMAMFYLETRFSGAFDPLFSTGVRRAEDRLAGGEGVYSVNVKSVNEMVERTRQADVERAIEKFGRGQTGLRDMTDSEARALLQLLLYQGYDQSDFRDMADRLDDRMEEFVEKQTDAVETRQKNTREKDK